MYLFGKHEVLKFAKGLLLEVKVEKKNLSTV